MDSSAKRVLPGILLFLLLLVCCVMASPNVKDKFFNLRFKREDKCVEQTVVDQTMDNMISRKRRNAQDPCPCLDFPAGDGRSKRNAANTSNLIFPNKGVVTGLSRIARAGPSQVTCTPSAVNVRTPLKMSNIEVVTDVFLRIMLLPLTGKVKSTYKDIKADVTTVQKRTKRGIGTAMLIGGAVVGVASTPVLAFIGVKVARLLFHLIKYIFKVVNNILTAIMHKFLTGEITRMFSGGFPGITLLKSSSNILQQKLRDVVVPPKPLQAPAAPPQPEVIVAQPGAPAAPPQPGVIVAQPGAPAAPQQPRVIVAQPGAPAAPQQSGVIVAQPGAPQQPGFFVVQPGAPAIPQKPGFFVVQPGASGIPQKPGVFVV